MLNAESLGEIKHKITDGGGISKTRMKRIK